MTVRTAKLRVVSFNIFYALRSRRLARTILEPVARLNPDVIALQEVWRGRKRDFAGDLAKVLGYRLLFAPRAKAFGREIGLALLTKKQPCATAVTVLPRTRLRRRIPRILQQATIVSGSTSWMIANVHLESVTSPGARGGQFVAALDALRKYQGSPLIILGDFNTLTAREMAKFPDVCASEGFTLIPSVPYTWKMLGIRRNLDWIAVRDCEITASGILEDVRGSDHKPVWADVRVRL